MIKAELRRLMHKKKDWMCFGILYVLFLALIVFLKQKQNIDANNFMIVGNEVLSAFFVIFIGTRIFTSVYLDDISSRKYVMILSNRRKTYQYLFEKIIVSILYTILVVIVSWVFFTIIFAILYSSNWEIYVKELPKLLKTAFNRSLLTVTFMSLASVLGYYFKKASSAKAAYIILVLNFIGIIMKLASLFSENISKVSQYMLSDYVNTWMMGEGKLSIVLGIAFIYFFVSYLLSYFILEKKDLA